MSLELAIFVIVGAIAVASALLMVISRNAVHSALWLILNFACIAFFYLTLGATFMALAQITVYAGAIMVLFLFVIMMIGPQRLPEPEAPIRWQTPVTVFLAVVLGTVFLIVAFAAILSGQVTVPGALHDVPTQAYGSGESIGSVLFNAYLLPFEMVSVVLLVAMIGAVVFTRNGTHSTGAE